MILRSSHRTPKAWARLASHQAAVASVLNSSSCGCGSRKPKAAPPRVKTDAKRCRRRGSCSPSVASHGARGSERSECRCILSRPNIEARRGEPSRGRETHSTTTIGIRGLSGATSTDLIFFYAIRGASHQFCCGITRSSAARDDAAVAPHCPRHALPTRRAALFPKGAAQAKHSHHGYPRDARRRRPPPPLPERGPV